MNQQLFDGNVLPRRWKSVEVARHRSVEIYLSFFDELHDGDASEGFRAGEDWEDRFACRRNGMLDIGGAEELEQNDLFVLNNSDLHTRNSPLGHLSADQCFHLCGLSDSGNLKSKY